MSKMMNGSRPQGREAQLLAALSQRLAHHLHVPVGEIDPRTSRSSRWAPTRWCCSR
jgi:hypothetical protein